MIDSYYLPLHDTNYNIISLINATDGELVERYTYTPYGQRTVYKPASKSARTFAQTQIFHISLPNKHNPPIFHQNGRTAPLRRSN